MTTFIRVMPGHYTSKDGRFKIVRTREGGIYSHEIMWVAYDNGKWLINAGTLSEAKTYCK
jgi:hypothetical protein